MSGTGGFLRLGPAEPTGPVVIAVPHAGRDYPPSLIAMARVERAVLEGLEDRFVDLLAGPAVAAGATALIAQTARAWIDLNRGERELDRTMLAPPLLATQVDDTARVRGGLGLVPRRAAGGAELWRRPLTHAELDTRIAGTLRPWHAAIAAALAAARARFGVAVLLDLHSMPPLPRASGGGRGARLVIGDRHGTTAAPDVRGALLSVAAGAELTVAVNCPYAGGRTLTEHGHPNAGVHAIQLEVDRSLYLTPDLLRPGPGLQATAELVAGMVAALAESVIVPGLPLAAE